MRLLFFLFALLFTLKAQAQNAGDCGTPAAPAHIKSFIRQLDFSQPRAETTIHLPVTIHIVRTSVGGGGFSENQAFLTICNLNQRTASSGLFFYMPGRVRYIDADRFYTAPGAFELFEMIADFNVERTINIYYTNLAQMGYCGFAFYPNSGPGGFENDGAIVMSFPCAQPTGTTLAHEMGHYLSLPHTFDGTSQAPSSINAERVTRLTLETPGRLGANCGAEGDGFCDTPADFIANRWSCPTPLTVNDFNGDRFRPDSSFYMSYANDICTGRFSEQQQLAMRSTVNTSSAPRGYLTTTTMPLYTTLTASSLLVPANGDTLVPNNAQFRWQSVPGADFYQLKIYVGTGFTILDTMISDTAYLSRSNKIRANRVHSWEVRALNGANLCTNFGQRGDFVTGMYSSTTGLNNNLLTGIRVYPNRLSAGQEVTISGLGLGLAADFRLYDISGRLLFENTQLIDNEVTSLELPWLSAQWLVFEITQRGRKSRHKLLLQQQ